MLGPSAVVGIGLMGMALTRRLAGRCERLLGHDVSTASREGFIEAGGEFVGSLDEIFSGAEYILLSVYSGEQALSVVQACPSAESLGQRKLFVCIATCDPSELVALASLAKGKGHDFVEMPISGSSGQFAQGKAVGLVSADQQVFRRNDALWQVICPKMHYLGSRIGDASKAKLAINLVLGMNRAALAEGLVFAKGLGLESRDFFTLLRESAAYSQVMDVKGSLMVDRQFNNPQSRVDQSHKDFSLMLELARNKGLSLPFASRYHALLSEAISRGEGHLDNAVIIEAVERFKGP